MGSTTPNISIYVPAPGETNYDAPFASGMLNIDQHDHSGPPTKGVPIATSGIADGSVTYQKLNANVADNATGIGTETGGNANKLTTLGLLKNIFQIGTTAGLIAKNGSLATAVTITGTTNQIDVTYGDGVGGPPTISLAPIVTNPTQPLFQAFLSLDQSNVTGNGTNYQIPFDTINIDQDGDYSNSTFLFTAPIAGSYFFNTKFAITTGSLGTSSDMVFTLYVNGSEAIRMIETFPQASAAGNMSYTGTGMLVLNPGDTVYVNIYFSGAGADSVGIASSSSFSGWLIA